MKYCTRLFLAFLLVFLSLQVQASVNVFLDDFDGGTVDATKWSITGSPWTAGSMMHLPSQASVYSQSSFSRTAGRALTTLARLQVSRPDIAFHFATARRPADTLHIGYGWGNTQDGNPNYRNASFAICNNTGEHFFELTDNIDTYFITVLKGTGAFHLLAGGRITAIPKAKLYNITHSGSEATFYVGSFNNTSALYESKDYIDQIRVDDLGGNWATDFGITNVYDSFNRSNSTNVGSPEKGGSAWSEASGAWSIASNKLRGSGTSGLCITGAGQSNGLWETRITPATGAGGGIVFRYQDTSNYWYFGGDSTGVKLVKKVGGSETVVFSTGASTIPAGSTSILTVRADGANISIYLGDSSPTGGHIPISDAALQTATSAGFFSMPTTSISMILPFTPWKSICPRTFSRISSCPSARAAISPTIHLLEPTAPGCSRIPPRLGKPGSKTPAPGLFKTTRPPLTSRGPAAP